MSKQLLPITHRKQHLCFVPPTYSHELIRPALLPLSHAVTIAPPMLRHHPSSLPHTFRVPRTWQPIAVASVQNPHRSHSSGTAPQVALDLRSVTSLPTPEFPSLWSLFCCLCTSHLLALPSPAPGKNVRQMIEKNVFQGAGSSMWQQEHGHPLHSTTSYTIKTGHHNTTTHDKHKQHQQPRLQSERCSTSHNDHPQYQLPCKPAAAHQLPHLALRPQCTHAQVQHQRNTPSTQAHAKINAPSCGEMAQQPRSERCSLSTELAQCMSFWMHERNTRKPSTTKENHQAREKGQEEKEHEKAANKQKKRDRANLWVYWWVRA